MSRLALLQEMLAEKQAGKQIMNKLTVENYGGPPIPDRLLPWTPNERPIYKAPSVMRFSAQDRLYKQPEAHQRFMRPMPAQEPVVLDATYHYIANKDRVHTPHIYDRVNFKAPSIIPRSAGMAPADYDASPESIAEGGLAKLLTKPLDVQVPDARDVKWIAERKRLDAAGQPDVLPFGRKQLTVTRRGVKLVDEFVRGVDTAHSIRERLHVLDESVKQGLAQTGAGIKKMGEAISVLLLRNSVVKELKENELLKLYNLVDSMNIQKEWSVSFKHRLWSSEQYKTDKTNLLLFLLSKLDKDERKKHANAPIRKYVFDEAKGKPVIDDYVSIGFLEQTLSKPDKKVEVKPAQPIKGGPPTVPKVPRRILYYIDLELGGVVPFNIALMLARGGADGNTLNEFRVPHRSIEPNDPDVIPVGIYNPVWAAKELLSKQEKQEMGVNINPAAGIDHKLIQVPQFVIEKAEIKRQAAEKKQRAAEEKKETERKANLAIKKLAGEITKIETKIQRAEASKAKAQDKVKNIRAKKKITSKQQKTLEKQIEIINSRDVKISEWTAQINKFKARIQELQQSLIPPAPTLP